MKLKMVKLVCFVSVAALVVMIWQFNSQRNKTLAVQDRLNDICRIVRAGLTSTAQEIRTNSTGKEAAIRRIHGDGDVTGGVVLRGCAPEFSRDAWRACADKNDEACMVMMLDDAAKSIVE